MFLMSESGINSGLNNHNPDEVGGKKRVSASFGKEAEARRGNHICYRWLMSRERGRPVRTPKDGEAWKMTSPQEGKMERREREVNQAALFGGLCFR